MITDFLANIIALATVLVIVLQTVRDPAWPKRQPWIVWVAIAVILLVCVAIMVNASADPKLPTVLPQIPLAWRGLYAIGVCQAVPSDGKSYLSCRSELTTARLAEAHQAGPVRRGGRGDRK